MPFLKIHQYICDHDSFVTAKKVYNRYAGFSKECHTLMVLFREQIESYKEKIGKGKAESTYRGLVADYKSLLLFMKTKKNIEDIAIDELEKTKRSTYGGAIGYISFNGNFDSCITIRTGVFKDGKAYIQAGGGIVYDSIPENEYQESINKASAVLRAIEEAGDIV